MFPGITAEGVRVFKDISAVIVIHKVMVDGPTVNSKGDKREKQTDPNIIPNLIRRIFTVSAAGGHDGITPR